MLCKMGQICPTNGIFVDRVLQSKHELCRWQSVFVISNPIMASVAQRMLYTCKIPYA